MKFKIYRRYRGGKSEIFEGNYPELTQRVAELLAAGVMIDNIKSSVTGGIEGGRAFKIIKDAMRLNNQIRTPPPKAVVQGGGFKV